VINARGRHTTPILPQPGEVLCLPIFALCGQGRLVEREGIVPSRRWIFARRRRVDPRFLETRLGPKRGNDADM
jgi:hypothetical protein